MSAAEEQLDSAPEQVHADSGETVEGARLAEPAKAVEPAAKPPTAKGRIVLGWWLYGLTLTCLVLALVIGALPLARSQGWLVDGGSATIEPAQLEQLQPRPADAGSGVIGNAAALPALNSVDGAKLSAAINAVPARLSGTLSGAAADLDGGGLGYAANADLPMVSASALKLLTSAAALEVLDPNARFRTRVVVNSVEGATQLTLIGGGDPLLASTPDSHPYRSWAELPSLSQLTEQTVAALGAQGVAKVSLTFDDSLFVGPDWHPAWHPEDRAWVAPITALAVDLGDPAGQQQSKDPSEAAAKIFAAQLRAAGLQVDGEPTRSPASTGSVQVAEVSSVPVLVMIEELLANSDNYVAEVVARQTALAAGAEPSFVGAAKAVQDQLVALGLWGEGHVISDGSGLSGDNRLSAHTLVKAVQLAAQPGRQSYLLAALPTAGANGTMGRRFDHATAAAGRGHVRAKTGSLDQVSALVGYTPTRDGALVAFAFIGNGLPKDQNPRPWLDELSSAITACECGS